MTHTAQSRGLHNPTQLCATHDHNARSVMTHTAECLTQPSHIGYIIPHDRVLHTTTTHGLLKSHTTVCLTWPGHTTMWKLGNFVQPLFCNFSRVSKGFWVIFTHLITYLTHSTIGNPRTYNFKQNTTINSSKPNQLTILTS